MANITQQFPTANGVSPEERGTSTQPFVIAQAPATGPQLIPWSKYIPFAKGAEVLVQGKIRLLVEIPFSGSGTIHELTDGEFDFSVIIPVDLKAVLPAFLASLVDPKGDVSVSAKITYVGEGSSNRAAFSITGVGRREKSVHIQSKPDERILTPPGGLTIPTGFPSPFPKDVEIREVHMVPVKDSLEIKVTMASPVPDFTINVSKKS